jgi:hypothetical protein
MRRPELEGNHAFELGVLSLIGDTHAALAELLDDLVMADGGADNIDTEIVAFLYLRYTVEAPADVPKSPSG